MKLVIVIDDLLPGGTEHALADHLQYKSDDLEVMVITLYGLGNIAEKITDFNIKVECLDIKLKGYFRACKRFREILKKEEPDIVLCMRDVSRALVPRVSKKYAKKIVMMWGNPLIDRNLKTYYLEKLQIKLTPGMSYYCNCNFISDELRRLHGLSDVAVIHNSFSPEYIDLKSKNKTSEVDVLKIISTGNLRFEKNHNAKVAIAKELKQRGIKFDMQIIGDGPLKTQLQELISESGLESEVKLLGRRNDVAALLQRSDIFLFTSTSEGFPVAVLEAMASSLTCVISDLPFISEIDSNKQYLDVLDQGDLSGMVDRIEYWSKNPKARIDFGLSARNFVLKNFNPKKTALDWENFLLNCLT